MIESFSVKHKNLHKNRHMDNGVSMQRLYNKSKERQTVKDEGESMELTPELFTLLKQLLNACTKAAEKEQALFDPEIREIILQINQILKSMQE